MANRVSSTLEKMKGIREVVFDTTGVGYLKLKKKAKIDREKIDKALTKLKVTLTKLEEQDVTKALGKFELKVRGVS